MIDLKVSTWYDKDIITKEIIYNNFRVIGISNKLDYSEDSLFRAWNNMKEEKPVIDNDLEESFEINENLEMPDEDEE